MVVRSLPMVLVVAFLSGAGPAAAQRTDILTGEPVRPPSAHPRAEPEIFNAPHAPRQANRSGDSPPLEIYLAPQIGAGSGYGGTNGAAGPVPRSRYPGRLPQERPY